MTRGLIFDISEMTLHDGPGLRTTVFFKGCPLRCLWCHNPEGISFQPQLMARRTGCRQCGRCYLPCSHAKCQPFGRCVHACPQRLLSLAGEWFTAWDLADRLLRHKEILQMNGGGVTLSGGEPLAQPDFLIELLDRLQPLHRVVETCGLAPEKTFRGLADHCDLIYLDIKHTDPVRHRQLTGADPTPIQHNLAWLKASGHPFVIRATLIPGLNDDLANLTALSDLLADSAGLAGVELLPYNPLARAKYEAAGVAWKMPELEPLVLRQLERPDDTEYYLARLKVFRDRGISVRIL